jgi:3-phosphoshikimate 1-carboxyvinyltransferase
VSKRTVAPARKVSGLVEVPGDKSISHRYAMLAALASGRSEITGYAAAADCQSTLSCIERLGASVTRTKGENGSVLAITGAGLNGLRRSRRALDAENSGTTMRLLTGILSGQSFDSTMTGDASLRKRPMRRVIDPLTKMGAHIDARDANFAPIEIHGSSLRPIHYALPVASAQVKSAVLLAGLFADGETSVEEPVCTRDHTEVALGEFGATLRRKGRTIWVTGRSPLQPRRLTVPGDLSSAVFLIAAALLLPDSDLMIHNVGLNPTRTAVLDVLCEWGAALKIVSVRGETGELTGDIAVHHSELKGGTLSGGIVAQLIDELPMLAALGPYTQEGVEIRDAGELRLKESDRVAVLAENLRRMGARVDERPDGLRVEGRQAGQLHGAEIDPAGDHRIAMAFAVAALGASGSTIIRDAECAAVSFPDFFQIMDRIAER